MSNSPTNKLTIPVMTPINMSINNQKIIYQNHDIPNMSPKNNVT